MRKTTKGITLIALVITIVILLILAVVTIIFLNNTNVINIGETAVQKYNLESIEEAIQLEYKDLLILNLGKVYEFQLAERINKLSEKYTDINDVTPGNGKVYYTLTLTGKEYQIFTDTGKIEEYIDTYEKVRGDASLWTRQGSTIIGYTGTNEQLKNVTVPNVLPDSNGNEVKITNVSLKGIDFQGTLAISSNLTVNAGAFQNCNNIEKVIIGNNVTLSANSGSGGSGSFLGCTSLKEVIIGKNIKFVDAWAGSSWIFYGCTALETVTVESVSQVGKRAFYGVGKALKGNIVVNEGIETIGVTAFENCQNVESITLPSTVKTIGASAFYNCETARINFPESIKTIGAEAFNGCKNMIMELKIKEGVTIQGGAFSKTGITSLEIGDGITLPHSSFQSCLNLKTLTIGDNVVIATTETGGHGNVGSFAGCTALKEVIMGENIKIGDGHGGDTWPFDSCTSLETMRIKSLSGVGKRAFLRVGKALKGNIIINEGVYTIGQSAFEGCINIERVTLPSTITTINGNAFYNCKGVQSFSVNMTEEAFVSVTKGSNWNTNVPVGITYLQTATE